MIKKFTTSLCIEICYDPQKKVFKFHKFFEHVQKAFEMRPNLCWTINLPSCKNGAFTLKGLKLINNIDFL